MVKIIQRIKLTNLSPEELEETLEELDLRDIRCSIDIQIIYQNSEKVPELDKDFVADNVLFWHQIFIDYYDSNEEK